MRTQIHKDKSEWAPFTRIYRFWNYYAVLGNHNVYNKKRVTNRRRANDVASMIESADTSPIIMAIRFEMKTHPWWILQTKTETDWDLSSEKW